MMMIQTDKLQLDDKKIISQKYMIPKILQEVSFNSEDIKIPDNTIEYAIKNYSQEEGVRNLKRCYENLLERLNILRLIKLQSPDQTTIKKLNLSANMEKLILSQLQFPLTITPEILSQLVEDNSRSNLPPAMMYS
jgi:ATP-dependent Lon protease